MIRFIRFLPVARRQCFFEIASPSLATSRPFEQLITVKYLSRLRPRVRKTRENAAASSKRFSFRNRCLGLPGVARWSSAAMTGVLAVSREGLRRQLGAAFGAPALEDEAAGLRGHASTKSVRPGAFDLARLIGAFHGFKPAVPRPLSGRSRRGRQGYADGFFVSIEPPTAPRIPASGGALTDGIDWPVSLFLTAFFRGIRVAGRNDALEPLCP